MADYREAFVGIDVAKLMNAIAIAESGRDGEIRYFGEVQASDAGMRRMIQRIAAKFDRVHFCYEAGPTGYGLRRLIRSLGHDCMVVAPSLIPRKPGDKVKTNRRDALALARLRAGELTAVWVPDEGHEAIRQNYNVQFVTAATLVAMLAKAHSDGSLDKQLTMLARPKLLIIDELGYLPFEANAAHLFFPLVSRRYETGSILITSNRSVGEWGGTYLVIQ